MLRRTDRKCDRRRASSLIAGRSGELDDPHNPVGARLAGGDEGNGDSSTIDVEVVTIDSLVANGQVSPARPRQARCRRSRGRRACGDGRRRWARLGRSCSSSSPAWERARPFERCWQLEGSGSRSWTTAVGWTTRTWPPIRLREGLSRAAGSGCPPERPRLRRVVAERVPGRARAPVTANEREVGVAVVVVHRHRAGPGVGAPRVDGLLDELGLPLLSRAEAVDAHRLEKSSTFASVTQIVLARPPSSTIWFRSTLAAVCVGHHLRPRRPVLERLDRDRAVVRVMRKAVVVRPSARLRTCPSRTAKAYCPTVVVRRRGAPGQHGDRGIDALHPAVGRL